MKFGNYPLENNLQRDENRMMFRHKIRLGATYHLCARPLLFGMTRSPLKNVELLYDEPGTLADKLEKQEVDAALIPSIEYLRGVGSYFIKGPALVASTVAGGLLLVSRKPLEEIGRVAVDEFCRTPLAALRIVLDSLHHLLPDICVAKNADHNWREHYDAVLLSGDKALHYLHEDPEGPDEVYDIGQMWYRLTSTPLVDSLWAYNDESFEGQLEKILHTSRNLGISSLPVLSNGLASTSPYDPGFLRDHFSNRWSYQMGAVEMEGLKQLEEYARRYKLIRKRRLEESVLVPGA